MAHPTPDPSPPSAPSAPSARATAADPRTPPTVLDHLAHHRDRAVRRAVIANPNTALATLNRTAAPHADALAGNALLDWLLIENAEFARDLTPLVRHRLLATPACSAGLLWWALRHGTVDDQVAVLANPSTTAPMRAWMGANLPALDAEGLAPVGAVDDEELVELLVHDAVPHWLLAVLPDPDRAESRRLVAAHRDAEPAVLRRLALDPDEQVRVTARAHPGLDPEWAALAAALDAGGGTLTDTVADEVMASSYGRMLVARRNDLPAAARARMVHASPWQERDAVAGNPALTLEELCRLAADADRDVRAAVAANPAAPPGLRGLLAHDTDERVRAAAGASVGEPGTTPRLEPAVADALGALGPLASVLLARDRAASVDTLAAFAHDEAWRVRLAVAANEACPPAVLDHLAADGDADVRQAVAQHPATARPARRRLAADGAVVVRAAVARAATDPALLTALAADPDADVRLAVATNAAGPTAALAALVGDAHSGVLAAVAAHPATPPTALVTLAGRADSDDVRLAFVRRGGLDRPVLQRLVGAERTVMRAATLAALLDGASPGVGPMVDLLAPSPWLAAALVDRLPEDAPELQPVLEALGASDQWRRREQAATHRAARPLLLDVLADDRDYDVRKAVAAHPTTRPDVVARLAVDANNQVRLCVARRADLSTELVERLADDDDADVCLALLDGGARPHSPTVAVLRGEPVTADELTAALGAGYAVRLAVAGHPDLTTEQAARLAADEAWQVRQEVAAHQALASAELARLATDHDRDVRAAVAGNARTDPAVLSALAGDHDERVRRAALGNPALPRPERRAATATLVRRCLRSSSPWSVAAAASSPWLEPLVLARPALVRSPHAAVRYALARHPATPPAVRAALAHDAHPLVRAAAAAAADRDAP